MWVAFSMPIHLGYLGHWGGFGGQSEGLGCQPIGPSGLRSHRTGWLDRPKGGTVRRPSALCCAMSTHFNSIGDSQGQNEFKLGAKGIVTSKDATGALGAPGIATRCKGHREATRRHVLTGRTIFWVAGGPKSRSLRFKVCIHIGHVMFPSQLPSMLVYLPIT